MNRLQTNIIPPDGPLDAPIWFIGEAPGAEEDELGRPFIGDAGKLHNRCMKAKGLLRSQVGMRNVFSQRPPENNIGYFFEDATKKRLTWEGMEHVEELKRWLENLLAKRERGEGGPNVLVALGDTALQILTGQKKITKRRGSIYPCTLVPGFKVYAMLHPSYVNRLINEPREQVLYGEKKKMKQNALPLYLIDLDRVQAQAKFPEIREPKSEIFILSDYTQALKILHQLNSQPIIACDIETIVTDEMPILWCIGFSHKPDKAYVVPFITKGSFHWSSEEEANILQAISRIFLNPNIQKIFQNGGYDLSVLGRYYGLRAAPGTWQDTMWCHQATFPYLMKALHVLTSIYTWRRFYKEDRKKWDGYGQTDEQEFIYNGTDCCTTREIWPLIENEAKQLECWQNYLTSMRSMESLLYMMIKGVKYAKTKQTELTKLFELEMAKVELSVKTLAFPDYEGGSPLEEAAFKLNLSSSTQVQRLLYGYLGLPIQYNHKTKKPSADKDALNKLWRKTKGKDEEPILKALLEFRKYEKLVSTYSELSCESDGRIRTSYDFVSTFRLSSSESHFGGGGNLQNIPIRSEEGKEVRKLFVSDEGFILLGADYDQAEAMVVAWEADDLEMIDLFLSKIDTHWEQAKQIFGLASNTIYFAKEEYSTRWLSDSVLGKTLRDIGKTIVYAMYYGMGPLMLQAILLRQGISLDADLCKALLKRAQIARPMVMRWQEKIREKIRISRTLISSFGDRREFRGRINEDLFRSAYAFSPQNTVGRMTQNAIRRAYEEIPLYQPLLNVHDELIGQCPEEKLEETIPLIREVMRYPLEINERSLTIPCTIKYGPNWGEMKELKDAPSS